MGKRVIALICALVLVAGVFTACGGKTKTVNDIKIELQSFQNTLNGGFTTILLVTNKTGKDCNAELTINLMGANNVPVGDPREKSIEYFAKGSTVPITFNTDLPVEDLNFTAVTTPIVGAAVDNDLDFDVDEQKNMATFSVKNKGKMPTEDFSALFVFYKGGDPVYVDWVSVDGLMPEQTGMSSSLCLIEFNDVEVYYHAKPKQN